VSLLQGLTKHIWFWRVMGIIGCILFFSWTGLSLAFLTDTVITGLSEWAPWAAAEAFNRTPFIAAYIVNSLLGIIGSIRIIQWIWPLWQNKQS